MTDVALVLSFFPPVAKKLKKKLKNKKAYEKMGTEGMFFFLF